MNGQGKQFNTMPKTEHSLPSSDDSVLFKLLGSPKRKKTKKKSSLRNKYRSLIVNPLNQEYQKHFKLSELKSKAKRLKNKLYHRKKKTKVTATTE